MNLVNKINKMKLFMVIINIVAVLYMSSIILFSTHYIESHEMARAFLINIQSVPSSPILIFIKSIVYLVVILSCIYFSTYLDRYSKDYIFLKVVEVFIGILLVMNLNHAYSGIMMLIFIDLFHVEKNHMKWILWATICYASTLLLDYNFVVITSSIPSIDMYIAYLPVTLRNTLMFFKSFIISLNSLIFLTFLVFTLLDAFEERRKMEEELEMASTFNSQLNSYIALSEKNAIDQERKRISREIHDTLGHALTGLSAGIDACIALIDMDQKRTKSQLELMSEMVREGIKDVRRSLNKLRPGALENRNLKDALMKMIEEYKTISHLDIDFYYEWDHVDFDNTKEDIIFRIIQESITNSLRHGHASRVEINLFNSGDYYYMIIQDNGIGFEKLEYGYGLKQMKERVSIIGGKVRYMNEDGFRTMVTLPKKKGEDSND